MNEDEKLKVRGVVWDLAMTMMPKNRKEIEAYWDETRKRIDVMLDGYGIKKVRCGVSIGPGWLPVVHKALGQMIEAGWDKELHQVKQKFCQLRIYIGEGMYDNVDNPVKRFFRKPIVALASSNKVPSKIRIMLWDLSRTRLFREHKPSRISEIIREAEDKCDDLCEVCGQERQKKGIRSGWALCDECGKEEKRT